MFCYKAKNELDDVSFITIQNGHRDPNTKMFQKNNFIHRKNHKTDHFFAHNKYVIQKYKKVITANKYYILGNYNNNWNSKVQKTRYVLG